MKACLICSQVDFKSKQRPSESSTATELGSGPDGFPYESHCALQRHYDDDVLDQPLDCTFDDDTVVSVRAVAIRPTRKSRRSPSGSEVFDDSIDKENVDVVRRPMVPAATDRRLQAFADYDLVGMRDNKTVVGGDDDDDEDSLPGDLFDNLGIDDCVSMNIVDRLSSLSEDPKTGLPVRHFTVHGGEDGKFNSK